MKEIKLSKGYVALVDDDDFKRLNAFKWCASVEGRGTKVYAIRWITDLTRPKYWVGKGKKKRLVFRRIKIRMHREVMGLPPGAEDPLIVDHLDVNSLNNQKANLEILTQEFNMERVPGWKRKKVEPCL